MNDHDEGFSRRSKIADAVGDIVEMCDFRVDMSDDEIEAIRQRQCDEVKKRFVDLEQRNHAEDLLNKKFMEFEQQRLRSMLNSVNPEKIWTIVNTEDVLSGFIAGPEIDRGGTAIINLCWTRFSKRTAVVKLINCADPRIPIDKLLALRELQVLMKINHSSIVKVYDAGYLKVSDGKVFPYVAMEWLPGESLKRWISAHLPSEKATATEKKDWQIICGRLVAILSEALCHCHEQEIAHGDFNPRNVRVCAPTPTRASLKIHDFGFSADRDGHLAGETRGYACPLDCGKDLPSTVAKDVFALGATLIFCLTGEDPPDTSDPAQFVSKLSATISKLEDPSLRLIVETATCPEIGGRYSSAQKLADDLDDWLMDRPLRHARKKYGTIEKLSLLIERCRKRNDEWDHLELASVVSWWNALCCATEFVAFFILTFRGTKPGDALPIVANVGVFAMLGMASVFLVITRKHVESRKIYAPFVAILVTNFLVGQVFSPNTPFRELGPDQLTSAVKYCILITAIGNILYANSLKYSPAASVLAWSTIAVAVAVHAFAQTEWMQGFAPALMIAVNLLFTVTFAMQARERSKSIQFDL